MSATTTYKIVRFYRDDIPPRTIKRGVSWHEAHEHCTDESTHTADWFDGYEEER